MRFNKQNSILSKLEQINKFDLEQLGPNTAENDLSYRAKHIIEFLDKGHRIKISMRFKGREISFLNKGMEIMLKLILSVEEHGVSESLPKLEGKQLIAYVKPIKK